MVADIEFYVIGSEEGLRLNCSEDAAWVLEQFAGALTVVPVVGPVLVS